MQSYEHSCLLETQSRGGMLKWAAAAGGVNQVLDFHSRHRSLRGNKHYIATKTSLL